MNATKLTFNLFFLLFSLMAFSQDIIYFEDGEVLKCEIKSISKQNVSYIRQTDEIIKEVEEGEEEEDVTGDDDIKPIKIKLKKTPIDYIKLNNPDKFYIKAEILTYVDSIYKLRPEYPDAFTTLVSKGKANLYLFHHGKVIGNKTTDTIKRTFSKGKYYTPTGWAVKKQYDPTAVSTLGKVSNKKAFKNFMGAFFSDCPKAIEKMNSKEFNKIMLMIFKSKTLIDYYNSNCN